MQNLIMYKRAKSMTVGIQVCGHENIFMTSSNMLPPRYKSDVISSDQPLTVKFTGPTTSQG